MKKVRINRTFLFFPFIAFIKHFQYSLLDLKLLNTYI